MANRTRWREALDAGDMGVAGEIRASADSGDGDALMMMGMILKSLNYIEPAIEHFRKGAEAGSPISMYHLAVELLTTTGPLLTDVGAAVVADDRTDEAVRWFKKSIAALSQLPSETILPDEQHTLACTQYYLACVAHSMSNTQQASTLLEELCKTLQPSDDSKSKALLALATLKIEQLQEKTEDNNNTEVVQQAPPVEPAPSQDPKQEDNEQPPPQLSPAARRTKWRAALEAGDAEIAAEIRTFADKGDGDALMMLGYMLLSCEYKPAALEHFKKGAEAGSPMSMYHFASEYVTTTGPILSDPNASIVADDRMTTAMEWFDRCVSSILLQHPESIPEDEENAMYCSQFYQACMKPSGEREEALGELQLDLQHAKYDKSKLLLAIIESKLEPEVPEQTEDTNPKQDVVTPPNEEELKQQELQQQKDEQERRERELQQQQELQKQQQLQREKEERELMQRAIEEEKQRERALQQQQEQKQRELEKQQLQQKPPPKITMIQKPTTAVEPQKANHLITNLLQPTLSVPPSNAPAVSPTPAVVEIEASNDTQHLHQEVKSRIGQDNDWKDDIMKLVLQQSDEIKELKATVKHQHELIQELFQKIKTLPGREDEIDSYNICFDKKLAPSGVMISPDGMTVMIPRGSATVNLITSFILSEKEIVEWDVTIDVKESTGWSLAAGISSAGLPDKPGDSGWGVDQSKKLLYSFGKGTPSHSHSWQAGWLKNKSSVRFRWEGPNKTLKIARSKPIEVSRTDFGFHSLPIGSSARFSPSISVSAKYSDVTIEMKRLTPEGQGSLPRSTSS